MDSEQWTVEIGQWTMDRRAVDSREWTVDSGQWTVEMNVALSCYSFMFFSSSHKFIYKYKQCAVYFVLLTHFYKVSSLQKLELSNYSKDLPNPNQSRI